MGSGSGYLTAVLAELVSPAETPGTSTAGDVKEGARVVGLEHIKALRDLGQENFGKGERGKQLLQRGVVEFVVGDGRKGWKEGSGDVEKEGWDAIHVGAAASELHGELVEQLRKPGR